MPTDNVIAQGIHEGPYSPSWYKRLLKAERIIFDKVFRQVTGLPGPLGPENFNQFFGSVVNRRPEEKPSRLHFYASKPL